MTYPAELAELIEEFQDVDDKMERLEMVFDMADEVSPLSPRNNGANEITGTRLPVRSACACSSWQMARFCFFLVLMLNWFKV